MNYRHGLMVGSVLLGAATSVLAAPPVVRVSDPELARLQGSWTVVSMTAGGKSIELGQRAKKTAISLEVLGERYEFRGMGADFKGQVKLDTVGDDRRIQFQRSEGAAIVNFYRLKDGKLTLSGANPDGTLDQSPEAVTWVLVAAQSPSRRTR